MIRRHREFLRLHAHTFFAVYMVLAAIQEPLPIRAR
jgi:hypothetical protein